jgi:N utilization substance protein B
MTNLSLQKKTAARMAAVQGLYRMAMTNDAIEPEALVASLKSQLKNNRDEQQLQVGMEVEPNYNLLATLLTGIAENLEEINLRLDGVLNAQWSRDRTSPLLIAVLQCGIFELFFHKDLSSKIVIDEYTRLARSFFVENEVNFIHAALSTLSQQYHE